MPHHFCVPVFTCLAAFAVVCAGLAQEPDPGLLKRVTHRTSDAIGQGALPAGKIQLTQPSTTAADMDPFNAYVPGLQSTAQLSLSPSVQFPAFRMPFLRQGQATPGHVNIAIPDWLYVDFRLASAATYTDNVFRDDRNKKSDLILQETLTIDTTLQMTDTFQLQVAGNLVYYRALGEGSVSGFGFRDAFYFDDALTVDDGLMLNSGTLFASQLKWDETFGDWETAIGDRFTIANRLTDDPFVNGSFQRATEIANVAGGSVGRLLAAESRLGLSGQHANYWYNGDFNNYTRTEDSATLWSTVDRDSMRFKPFADFTLSRIQYSEDNRAGNVLKARLGARGPVTELMNVEAYGGFARIDDPQAASDPLWKLSVEHLMNTSTRHQILIQRTLGPSSDALQTTSTDFQYRLGHQLMKSATLWGAWDKTLYQTPGTDTSETQDWTLLGSFNYELAKDLNGQFQYQYLSWSSTTSTLQYTENRITLSLAWDI